MTDNDLEQQALRLAKEWGSSMYRVVIETEHEGAKTHYTRSPVSFQNGLVIISELVGLPNEPQFQDIAYGPREIRFLRQTQIRHYD